MKRIILYCGAALTAVTSVFVPLNWVFGNYDAAILYLGISLFCGIVTFAIWMGIK